MKNKLLGLGILVLVFAIIVVGVPVKKVLAAGETITSSTYDRTTGDLVLTGLGFSTGSTIDATTLTITGVGTGTASLTIATANPTPISATSARVVIAGADKIAVDALLDTIGIVDSDTIPYNLSAAVNWQGTNLEDLTTSITVGESPAAVDLLTLATGNFAIFANTGISSTGTTSIIGDIGVGPGVTSTAITGNFALTAPPTTYTTSALVTGKVYAYNYDVPTPAKVNQASLDLTTAYNNALVPANTVLDAGADNLGGLTLAPGVYTFTNDVIITSDVTLSGGPDSVWIFQIPGTLDISSATSILLSGGSVPANIFWAVAGTTQLQTTSSFEGNILTGPGASTIAMLNGATLNGRALGQTNVSLDANTITSPNAPASSSDETLSNLVVTPSTGTLTPFSLPILGPYTINVPYSVRYVTITPTANEAHATIAVNGNSVISGSASASIQLNMGSNLITTEVTAQDDSTNSYMITIVRAHPSTSGSIGGRKITPTPTPTNESVAGCSNGNLFNTSTGQACVNNEKLEIIGCGNRTTGFSTATGNSCAGNHVTTVTIPGITVVATYNFGLITLKNGSRGQSVVDLQKFLNANLNLGLVVDGIFGSNTASVVKKWQGGHALKVDGIVGPMTKVMMNTKE